MPNTTELFETVDSWLSPAEAGRVFVQNPARLYGFG
jgi:predicted TIM-barrel fold metal-dependent hydrolase